MRIYFVGLVTVKHAVRPIRRFTLRNLSPLAPPARCAWSENFVGGGDGTCTRVPTQDYLAFFAHSLLSGSPVQDSKPTCTGPHRKSFQARTFRCHRRRSICVILRQSFGDAKGAEADVPCVIKRQMPILWIDEKCYYQHLI